MPVFDWSNLIAALIGAVPTAIGFVAWAVRAEARSTQNASKADQAIKDCAALKDSFSEYKERVARDYVTFQHVRDMEERIMAQFDRLYDAVSKST